MAIKLEQVPGCVLVFWAFASLCSRFLGREKDALIVSKGTWKKIGNVDCREEPIAMCRWEMIPVELIQERIRLAFLKQHRQCQHCTCKVHNCYTLLLISLVSCKEGAQ